MTTKVFRVLDKLEKQGLEAVQLELTVGRVDASGDKIPGLGLSNDQAAKITDFLNLPKEGRKPVLQALASLFQNVPNAEEGLSELQTIDTYLTALNIPEDKVSIDTSIARGLDYYTGPVFEAILLDAPEFGTVFGGGRYDGLVERFLGKKIPATGASIGVDRLFAALLKLETVTLSPSTAQVLVTVMDSSKMIEYQQMTRELRLAGINTELYLGEEKGLGKQLQYANRQKIPVAVIAGSNEFNLGHVSIKDLRAGAQRQTAKNREEWLQTGKVGQVSVLRNELVTTVKEMLS
jgi:histidyl-tRNA synthetase